jgi:hypothetical protein
MGGACECGNAPLGCSLKCGKFLDLAEDLLTFQAANCLVGWLV